MSKTPFTFKIDKGIPAPEYGGWRIYDLAKLKPGHSFKFPADRVPSVRAVAGKRQRLFKKERYLIRPWKNGDYRCWRTK